ncbi:MAG: hypothetical protein ACPG6L_08525 [Nereida ignava]
MNIVRIAATILFVSTPTLAEELYFEGPGNSIIQMTVAACPDQMICMPSTSGEASASSYDLNIAVPQWAEEIAMPEGDDGAAAAAYTRGMSDGYIVDWCNLCHCCVISLDPDLGFEDWSTAQDVFSRPALTIAE